MVVPAAESDRPSLLLGTKRHWTHKNDAAVLLLKAKFPFTSPCNPNGAMGLLTELITVSATERGGDDLTTLSLVRDMAMMASQLDVLNVALSMFEQVLPNTPRLLEPTSKLLFTTRSDYATVLSKGGRWVVTKTALATLVPQLVSSLGAAHPLILQMRPLFAPRA